MRAVRLTGPGLLEQILLPDPSPGEGEVVVRVAACGVCGSDLSCFRTGVFSGSVLGHEIGGVIESVGPGVDGWAAGDAVAVDPKMPCGACADCAAGAAHRCPSALAGGIGAVWTGGFAEMVRAPSSLLHRLPPAVSPEDACLAEPLSCAIHGVDRAGPRPGERAVVWGLGPIGLFVVAVLRTRGVGPIVGVDPVEARRRLALDLGASVALAPGDDVRAAAVGAAFAAECSGKAAALQECANAVAAGGRLLLLGVPMTEATVVPMVWVTRELTLIGSIASTPGDFAAAIDLIAAEPSIARIVTSRVALEDLPAAVERLSSPAGEGKVAVDPRL